MKEFYPTVNAFLSAARSVLSVACHELGWKRDFSSSPLWLKFKSKIGTPAL